ncbi:cobalt-precorrin-6A reductase [Loktanella sp. D2R18]|uniref:cobalt-precorrin-6A reductase n=1 Tax=Rhodobacterales TaxID=204455 RepID=UPI000DEC0023|nr:MULTISPECIES: cobalt-precorrin-6A reductase [Rhodobacterales]MDO6590685.1 cobalt-precorrin-6A reductase [Yoonia sp. 1_MG-2023]RBW44691.1 cobalt-precorrin-6A reductase [Loktanella sp. D2R18]
MTLLILGGTGDARRIAQSLQGADAIISLAGATRAPEPLSLPTRIGGFGGDEGFRAFLRDNHITAVLDATHPFADNITQRTARICAKLNLPYLQMLRPGWVAEPGDDWTEITREEDAVDHIPLGSVVFLGTGRQTLNRFANLTGREVICRQIDPPKGPFPFAGGRFLVGRPPFSVEAEMQLFSALRATHLVVKNAGGAASRTKLTAANHLGIRVLMVARPPRGDWPIVESIDAALGWVRAL